MSATILKADMPSSLESSLTSPGSLGIMCSSSEREDFQKRYLKKKCLIFGGKKYLMYFYFSELLYIRCAQMKRKLDLYLKQF